jgi:hypothetical protein
VGAQAIGSLGQELGQEQFACPVVQGRAVAGWQRPHVITWGMH